MVLSEHRKHVCLKAYGMRCSCNRFQQTSSRRVNKFGSRQASVARRWG